MAKRKEAKRDDTVNMVLGLLEQSEGFYGETKAGWDKNRQYWKNSAEQRKPSTKTKMDIGIAWLICDGVLAAITDGRPRPVFIPNEKGDVDKANAVAKIITGPIYEQLRLDRGMEDLVTHAICFAGAAVSRAGVDSAGNLFDTVYNPKHCYAEPNVTDIDNMTFFATRTPEAVGRIRRAYGSKADGIAAEEIDSMEKSGATWGFFKKANGKMKLFDKEKYGKTAYDKWGGSIGRAFLTHIWIEDLAEGVIPFEEDEVTEEHQRMVEGMETRVKGYENHPKHIRAHQRVLDVLIEKWNLAALVAPDATGKMAPMTANSEEMEKDILTINLLIAHVNEHIGYPQSESGLLYPQGREIWICQDRVLMDRKSAFGNPYKAFQALRDPWGDFWNMPLMEYLVPIQEQMNYLVSKICDHANLVANGRGFYNAHAGILWDKLKAISKEKAPVGVMIPTDGPPQQAVWWDYGGEMPAYVFHLLGALEGWAFKLGGYTEAMQGMIPKYASGSAISQGIQQAGVRIRKLVNHLGWYYRDKFREYVKYLRYADPTTVFSIIGKDNKNEYIAWHEIDFDAMDDIRIDVRNVLGTWREEQFNKLNSVMAARPELAEVVLPALAEYLDVKIDTGKMKREQELENALSMAHDEISKIRAEKQQA